MILCISVDLNIYKVFNAQYRFIQYQKDLNLNNLYHQPKKLIGIMILCCLCMTS